MFNSFPIPKPNGGGNNIKSYQIGSFSKTTASNDVTLTNPVELKKSIVRFTTNPHALSQAPDKTAIRASLTDSSTINFVTASISPDIGVWWEVIEFNNVKSLQTGTTTGASSYTLPINTVNPSKSLIFFSFSISSTTNDTSAMGIRTSLTNPSQLFFSGIVAFDLSWQLIEFI